MRLEQRVALGLLGAAMIVGGSFGPWKTALGIISVSGTSGNGDGLISLVCGLVAAGLVMAGRRAFAAIAAGIALLVGIVDLVTVLHQVSGSDGLASLGWGLPVLILGAVLVVGSCVDGHRAPSPTIDTPSEGPPPEPRTGF